ncbi:MAG: hypothetical protein V3V08_05375 [Nannocystaceae bacterium]
MNTCRRCQLHIRGACDKHHIQNPEAEKDKVLARLDTRTKERDDLGVRLGEMIDLADERTLRVDTLKAIEEWMGCLRTNEALLSSKAGRLEAENAELRGEVERLKAQLDVPTQLDRIRSAGWSVAVHNDYQQDGQFHTFWLVTKGTRCAKGEGTSDMVALDAVQMAIGGFWGPASREVVGDGIVEHTQKETNE